MSTTRFTHNVALLIPEPHWPAAGAIIAIISGQQSDLMQFGRARFGGYDACNVQATEAHVQALLAAASGKFTPEAPEWDVDGLIDMDAVHDLIATAQYVLTMPEGPITLTGGAILGLDMDVAALAAACGLERVDADS